MPRNTVAHEEVVAFDHSTFDNPQRFSSQFPIPEDAEAACNFITFLTAVQQLRVPMLPLKWQPKRQVLGRGGTSQVNQGLATLQASFAFKRIADRDKLDKPEAEVFRCIINEIVVLCHPAIRNHPTTLQLQGICWDMPRAPQNDTTETSPHPLGAGSIWPVFVFEKSGLGDLYHFASLPVARNLGIKERLSICYDIGHALATMQSNLIIHGDVKPDNVLVFEEQGGSFTAKLADFGFSAWYASSGDSCIFLPRSQPWYAPECNDYPHFTPAQALKTDVFSFGMLCLWFIFEKYFSGLVPLPDTVQAGTSTGTSGHEHQPLKLLEDFKRSRSLRILAEQLVVAEADADASTRSMLQRFFSGCLSSDPESRDIDIIRSLDHFNPNRLDLGISITPSELQAPRDHDFKIYLSLTSFYQFDYRLRSCVLQSLEKLVSKDPTSPLSVQLAICYELGFGGVKSCERLSSAVLDKLEFQSQLEAVKAINSLAGGYAGVLYQDLAATGYNNPIHPALYYMREGMPEAAKSVVKAELERLEIVLGRKHPICILLLSTLGGIAYHQHRYRDAETLYTELLDICRETLGKDHRDTIAAMGNLAVLYAEQGRSEQAESLALEVIEICRTKFGKEHSITLSALKTLAMIYYESCQWRKSEELLSEIASTRQRVFGPEHESTIKVLSDLASVYEKQGRWEDARELNEIFMDTYERVLDDDSDAAMLAMLVQNPDRAEEFGIEVMDNTTLEDDCAPPRPPIIIKNLASTYRKLGLDQEADNASEMLHGERSDAIEDLIRDDPDSFVNMDALLPVCRPGEAEKYGIEIFPLGGDDKIAPADKMGVEKDHTSGR